MKDTRVTPCFRDDKDTGTRLYFWLVTAPAPISPRQLERIRLGALKATKDRYLSLLPFQTEARETGRKLIEALENRRISLRVQSKGDIVLFEASNRSDIDRPTYSFGQGLS